MPISPTTFTPVPIPPTRNDPTSFKPRADAFLGAFPTFQTEMNNLAQNVYSNALGAEEQSANSASSAVSAASSADIALAASNFKGEYSSLTGALNRPASVRHLGRYWLLIQNLANVTTAVPGTHSAWVPLETGIQLTQVLTASATLVTGIKYIVAAAGIVLTSTAIPTKGNTLSIREVIQTGTYTLDLGANKIRGKTWGSVPIRAKGSQMDVVYEDSTRGFV